MDPGLDALFFGKTEAVSNQKRYHRSTPLAPLSFRTKSFRIHKGIEDTHISRALSWVVLQIEQLETCHILSAQIHLDVLLIKLKRPGATGPMEGFRLIQHAGFLQTRAEHLYIIRIEHTRIFLDFIEVWVGLELCCLV